MEIANIFRRSYFKTWLSPLYASITPQFLQRNQETPTCNGPEEGLHLFHEKIISNQEKSLFQLAQELSDWLNEILQIPDAGLDTTNLVEKLQSGVILIKLAQLIQEKAALLVDDELRPKIRGRIWPDARPGSFFARDNIAIFITFCGDMGIHSSLLFETNDLVGHGEVRNVLICLLEVNKLAVKYGINKPGQVTRKIRMEEKGRQDKRDDFIHDKNFNEENCSSEEYDENCNKLPAIQINSNLATENDLPDGSLEFGYPEKNELTNAKERECTQFSANDKTEVHPNFQYSHNLRYYVSNVFPVFMKYIVPPLVVYFLIAKRRNDL